MMSAPHSPSDSSEGEYEDDAALPKAQWQLQEQASGRQPTTVANHAPSTGQIQKVPLPMQKRRRVTRACDECRRKKIKCDGKQPCTHCTVYSYDCTYDQPSNRRRNPAPQYIEALENRLQRAEALLAEVLPNVDLDDPNADIGRQCLPQPSVKQERQPLQTGQIRPWAPSEIQRQHGDGENESMLESMVTDTGLLDLDDDGNWDFHGRSSGRVFLRKMRDQFGDLMGKQDGHAMPFLRYKKISQSLDSPKPSTESAMDPNLPVIHDLPAKHCAKMLCENALDDAGAIMRVVHQPTFYAMIDRIYDTPYEEFGDEEQKFVPLLYGVISVGALFAKSEQSQLQTNGYENAIDQGYHWFRISRQMTDLMDCRDLTSLQTIIYMVIFLQSSARLSDCYSYIGIVLRSAIRMGLHRSVSNAFDPIERELRKRIFWVVRKMDIYVGALLGLPQTLSDDDIDQDTPLEVDDEYITKETILPMPPEILAKVVKYIYPIKGSEHSKGKDKSFVVSHAKIREIEQDLQSWMEALPMPFKPGEEASCEFMRMRHLLRMAYAHIQMLLYRPFLHYVSPTVRLKHMDKRAYACAAACVSVSRNIIHLTGEMKRKGLLVGSYWFYMYTTFFSIISLVFYVLENYQNSSVDEILKDAYEGKDTLAALASKSLAADRCSKVLTKLFEQLSGKLQAARSSGPNKKRQAPLQQSVTEQNGVLSEPDYGMKLIPNATTNHVILPASSTPAEQGSRQQSLIAPNPSTMRHPVATSIDAKYHRGSQDPYSPSNPNSTGIHTPNSQSSSLPSSQGSYPLHNLFPDQDVPDFAAMMFPSADPFAYPNQPMTTLERGHFIKQENTGFPMSFGFDPTSTTSAPYENYDGQMFGALPSYLTQGQQTEYGMQAINNSGSMTGADPTASSMAMQGVDAIAWPEQQQRQKSGNTNGMNYDQLFGEDWGGWMNQGYGL